MRRAGQRDHRGFAEDLFCLFSWKLISARVRGNYCSPGKEPSKMIRKVIPETHIEPDTFSIPQTQSRNLIVYRSLGRVLKRVLPQGAEES